MLKSFVDFFSVFKHKRNMSRCDFAGCLLCLAGKYTKRIKFHFKADPVNTFDEETKTAVTVVDDAWGHVFRAFGDDCVSIWFLSRTCKKLLSLANNFDVVRTLFHVYYKYINFKNVEMIKHIGDRMISPETVNGVIMHMVMNNHYETIEYILENHIFSPKLIKLVKKLSFQYESLNAYKVASMHMMCHPIDDVKTALRRNWREFVQYIIEHDHMTKFHWRRLRHDLIADNEMSCYRNLYELTGKWYPEDLQYAVDEGEPEAVSFIYGNGCGQAGITCIRAVSKGRWRNAGVLAERGFPQIDRDIECSEDDKLSLERMVDMMRKYGMKLTVKEEFKCECEPHCNFKTPNRLAAYFLTMRCLRTTDLGPEIKNWIIANCIHLHLPKVEKKTAELFEERFSLFINQCTWARIHIDKLIDENFNDDDQLVQAEVLNLWKHGYGIDDAVRDWIAHNLRDSLINHAKASLQQDSNTLLGNKRKNEFSDDENPCKKTKHE